METSSQIHLLKFFLKKIHQLRGYGDMNSYILAYEYKKNTNLSELKLNKIIVAFSAPKTWYFGKTKFIDEVETQIDVCITYKNYFS
ncbi:hypothetical protein QWY86_12845 [Pedobacter aquatilis]|uniref:hypothetical protein n=1 Tax=Pedobacter aquatilis TaxID=351343 RepID=UPI0025B4B955|nr:hypothetical protein [Pedobacter aquatilis]MDN3587562.1 hypothetical protein [Pedobacter aquatilis]